MTRSPITGIALLGLALGSLTACVADDVATGTEATEATATQDRPMINGFNYPVWAADGYERPVTATDLDEIVATGAGWVALSITWYQDDPAASCPAPVADKTVRLEGLRLATRLATERGLQVAYKPMVDLPGASDRSVIDPADPSRWFECYQRLLDDLVTVAADEGVGLIEIGTELAGTIRHEDEWRTVIASVRQSFPGRLTYGANFDEIGDVGFWDDLDAIGVSAYWSIAKEPTTDLDELAAGWAPAIAELSALSARWDRPIVLTELGYRSQQGVTVRPWDWNSTAPRDEAEQAAAFESARRAFSNTEWFEGVLIWTWDDVFDLPVGAPTYSPNGTASLPIIEAWFADHWAG